eukprot:TRINITY_DN2299_c0_g1_i1.p1 TRINITY_DN2299_c0_g1~~TRINITY_DN2299_c0_g1_i1.p1  ORF type:complete len:309 (+),score=53.93 TRINITY_DN2299_c0_g1_i1:93-929(+)
MDCRGTDLQTELEMHFDWEKTFNLPAQELCGSAENLGENEEVFSDYDAQNSDSDAPQTPPQNNDSFETADFTQNAMNFYPALNQPQIIPMDYNPVLIQRAQQPHIKIVARNYTFIHRDNLPPTARKNKNQDANVGLMVPLDTNIDVIIVGYTFSRLKVLVVAKADHNTFEKSYELPSSDPTNSVYRLDRDSPKNPFKDALWKGKRGSKKPHFTLIIILEDEYTNEIARFTTRPFTTITRRNWTIFTKEDAEKFTEFEFNRDFFSAPYGSRTFVNSNVH